MTQDEAKQLTPGQKLYRCFNGEISIVTFLSCRPFNLHPDFIVIVCRDADDRMFQSDCTHYETTERAAKLLYYYQLPAAIDNLLQEAALINGQAQALAQVFNQMTKELWPDENVPHNPAE